MTFADAVTPAPYPDGEQCDRLCGRMAELVVLDLKHREIAVCCESCAPSYVPTFEDRDGNEYNP